MSVRRVLQKLPFFSWILAGLHFWVMLRAHSHACPVVWISPSGGGVGSAADLRALAVGKTLGRFGWCCVTLHPRLGQQARRILLRLFKPDVVLLQQTRHPLNRPEIYFPVPSVLDVDDADIINPSETARIGDVAARCYGVVAGSRHLAGLFRAFNPAVRVIWTGTYIRSVSSARPNAERGRILAWAPSDPFGYPVELALMQMLVERLSPSTKVEFRVYGVSPARHDDMHKLWNGRLNHVHLRLMPPMPYKEFVDSLAEVAVGLQPVCEDHEYSLGKSFGKALAYLAADVAVVASNNIDHPLFFEDGVNGRLLLNEPTVWAQACDQLLSRNQERQGLVLQARQDFLARLTTDKSAQLMSDLLHRARLGQAWPRGLAKSKDYRE